jgi:putative transposase
MERFRSRARAGVIVERWRRHYNEDRPHSGLGDRTPKQVKDEHKQ